MTVRATYRLQLNKAFDFSDAGAIAPYLAKLGVSHAYVSPITVAQRGSMHGYDVIDPTRVNPELGGEDGLAAFRASLDKEALGLIIDIVPNHMGIAKGRNRYWQDVLENGRASPYARFFDIDWTEPILLPLLGEPLAVALAKGALRIERSGDAVAVVAYSTTPCPIRPEDRDEALDHLGEVPARELLDRQHWRLAWWRVANDELNWRRFFTINELAAVRVEDEPVFDATHALYFRLWDEGIIDGVRIDHVDGLTDPSTYLQRLRRRMPDAYIVVEKILGPGETLPPDWPVEGTTGYDFMEQVSALLHDASGEAPLNALWSKVSGRPADFAAEELVARRDMLSWQFEGQLSRCVSAFERLCASASGTPALTRGMIRRAIERLLWTFPVYRTYGPDAPPSDEAIRTSALASALPVAPPGEAGLLECIVAWLAGRGSGDQALVAEAVQRFQQLSAPIAAKAVEDTAFYRFGRLLSRDDVGFDPARFSMSIDEFHSAMEARAESLPCSMLATATHDHKRGEDVRARLAVLGDIPGEWTDAVERWDAITGAAESGVAAADVYQLYQMLVGAWPAVLESFVGRIAKWQQKALREAKLRSSWAAPDEAYEASAQAFLLSALDNPAFISSVRGFVERIRPAAEAKGLVQAFLRCAAPGVADMYQGSEFEDLTLVDPDNRRAVDFSAREQALGRGGESYSDRKQALIARMLKLRQEHPGPWQGDWQPVAVEGPRAADTVAFLRRGDGLVMSGAALLKGEAAEGDETSLCFPHRRRLASELFAETPVFLQIEEC